MKKITFFAFHLAIGLVTFKAQAQSYGLDPTFGTAGVATVAFPSAAATDALTCVALQPNGYVLLAGLNNTSFGLARLTTTGQPDPLFGTNGVVRTTIAVNNPPSTTTNSTTPTAVLVQADSKIAVAGSAATNAQSWRICARYLSNGALDATFANSGNPYGSPGIYIPYQGAGGLSSYILALQQQTDGKLLNVGYRNQLSGNTVVEINRLTAAGVADNSYTNVFPTGVSYGTTITYAIPSASVIDNADRLLTAGSYSVSNQNYSGPSGAAIVRYLDSGTFDPNFGTNGIAFLSPAMGGQRISWGKMQLQPDNKIVVAGLQRRYVGTNTVYDTLAVARYNQNGTLDTSFGRGGVVKVASGTTTPYDNALFGFKLLSNGEMVAGINTTDSPALAFRLVRLSAATTAAAALPAPINLTGLSPRDLVVQPNDQVVVAGTLANATGAKSFAAARFTYSGPLSSRIALAGRSIDVYPNPATSELAVRLAGATTAGTPVTLRLLNTLGQEISIRPAVLSQASDLRLPIASVAPGVYTLLVQGPDFVASKRFTKAE